MAPRPGTAPREGHPPGDGRSGIYSMTTSAAPLFFMRQRRDFTSMTSCGSPTAPTAGTVLVRTSSRAPSGATPRESREMSGVLFFSANDGGDRRASCGRSTGRGGQPARSRTSCRGAAARAAPQDLVNLNGVLFFSADRRGGTGARSVADRTAPRGHRARQGHPGRRLRAPTRRRLVNVNNTLYFVATTAVTGPRALEERIGTARWHRHSWRDSSSPEAQPGSNCLVAAPSSSSPMTPAERYGRATATAPGGPLLVTDIRSGASRRDPSLTTSAGRSSSCARTARTGSELWKRMAPPPGTGARQGHSRGTAAATQPEPRRGRRQHALLHRQRRHQGRELWKSDGTAAGHRARQGHLAQLPVRLRRRGCPTLVDGQHVLRRR